MQFSHLYLDELPLGFFKQNVQCISIFPCQQAETLCSIWSTMWVFAVVQRSATDVRITSLYSWTFHLCRKLVHRCKRLWVATCSQTFGNSSVTDAMVSAARWRQHSLNCQGVTLCYVWELFSATSSTVWFKNLVLIWLNCVRRFLLVQVKRYAVQTAVAEKVTSSLRVPISLSVKNYVMDDVVMPAPWLPHRLSAASFQTQSDQQVWQIPT